LPEVLKRVVADYKVVSGVAGDCGKGAGEVLAEFGLLAEGEGGFVKAFGVVSRWFFGGAR
jgi:hypothetical protein